MPTATTTRADRKGRLVRVALVVDYLRGERQSGAWRSGQQIVEHIKQLSAQIGEQTAYNSSTGAARNARALAKQRGLAWWTLDVNRAETGPGNPGTEGHRLYCVVRRNERPPGHRAIDAGAVPIGDPPLVEVAETDLERSEAEVERREAALRGGPGPSGSSPTPPDDRDGTRPFSSHDGRRLGPEPEPEAGEQRRLL